MKYLITFLIVLTMFITTTKQKEYICIRHVGANDKPIPTLIISKDSVSQYIVSQDVIGEKTYFYSHNYIVNEISYNKLKTLILGYRNNEHNNKGYPEFEIYIKGDKVHKYSLGYKKSIKLINLLIKSFKNDKNSVELDSAFIKTLKRFK
jgi:hypothetical protein